MGFEAVAWGDARPADLRDDQVTALTDYVQRGGHLVISILDTGDAWSLASPEQNRLAWLLPQDLPERQEAVPLSSLLSVLTKARSLEADFDVTLHVFQRLGPAGRLPPPLKNHYQPLIATDDGRVIAVWRSYGFGRVTVLGLNLTNRRLLSLPRAVQADVLWNRILGRRVDTPSGLELRDIDEAKMRSTTAPSTDQNLVGGARVTQLINMTGSATRGLAASFLLFVVYWATTVGSFFVLKHYRLERHAWMAFAASAALFTALAWGVVALIKPTAHRVRHLTFLDMMARPEGDRAGDPQLMRAVSYFSLNLPGYRPTPVFLESLPGQRDLLCTWAAPDEPPQPFPNPDRYRVDLGGGPAAVADYLRLGEPPEYRRPARATATLMYANWLGGGAHWTGTIRPWAENPLRVTLDRDGNERIEGYLVHDLPGPLENPLFIWVTSKRIKTRSYFTSGGRGEPWIRPDESGSMLGTGIVWKASGGGRWDPGVTFNPAEQAGPPGTPRRDRTLREWTADLCEPYARSAPMGAPFGGEGSEIDRFRMLSFFNQLDPPAYLANDSGGAGPEHAVFFRHLGRELDLSPWLAGPCLIVIGELRGPVNPLPLWVDGEAPAVDEGSRTIVRWICPLDIRPEIAFPSAVDRNEGAGNS
jgi:hypothetical protein